MPEPKWSPSEIFGAAYRTSRSASLVEVEQAEIRVSAVLPDDLRRLYLMSDGVWDDVGQWFVVWPLSRLVEANAVYAEDNEWSLTDLVGFGDDGTGSPFCFRRSSSGIYFWSHLDARATLLASDLPTFWYGWTHNRLPLH